MNHRVYKLVNTYLSEVLFDGLKKVETRDIDCWACSNNITIMIEGNNIIFGNVGDAEAVVLTPNEMNTDTSKAKLAKLKDNLVNQELNIGIKYNGPTVHVDNNLGVEQMSENYAQYLKDNLYK
jgi:hypothetical protein